MKLVDGSGMCSDDKRLTNCSHITISDETRKYVEQHIKSFPAYRSHYCRESSSRMYLSSDLNVKKMYDMYLSKCETDNLHPVHYNTFRLIFRTFNLSFKKPQKDSCNDCDKYKINIKAAQDDDAREAITRARDQHQKTSKFVYQMKREDVCNAKRNSTICTASFDLQKCLATPHLRCGSAYYKRQLYTYNLTVFYTLHDGHHVKCFMWDETVARRGAQEIGSCIMYFVQDLLVSYPHIRLINFYSDRCSGQNHNMAICTMFSYITECLFRNGLNIVIRHHFMVSGHSHMEVDSVHAAIEKAKKIASIDIETPRDWAVFIAQVNRNKPFEVVELDQTRFYALKDLSSRFKRPKLNDLDQQLKFKPIVSFQYKSLEPGVIGYKDCHFDETFKTFTTATSSFLAKTAFPQLQPLNQQPLNLPQAKLQDLRDLMEFVSNKSYYETMLKNITVAKRGRKQKDIGEDFVFDDDMDPEEELGLL